MILKIIHCQVFPEERERFAEGQKAWRTLAGAHGFHGQIGGWARADANLAIIINFWNDEAAYDHFMAHVHDDIFQGNQQMGTYDPRVSSVSLWTVESGEPPPWDEVRSFEIVSDPSIQVGAWSIDAIALNQSREEMEPWVRISFHCEVEGEVGIVEAWVIRPAR